MIPYGKMFQPGQVVLVHIEDQPGFFALIEGIEPDRKKGWWQMTFVVLALPLKRMTWVLDDEQLRGQAFTMNQVPIQIKQLELPEDEPQPKIRKPQSPSPKGNVVSMFDEE